MLLGMDTIEPVRNFVIQNFLFGRSEPLANDQSFLESGIIDSTGILELVVFLEKTYGIQIGDDELLPENLDSINNIARFLSSKVKV
jgi:acyl carrier protein